MIELAQLCEPADKWTIPATRRQLACSTYDLVEGVGILTVLTQGRARCEEDGEDEVSDSEIEKSFRPQLCKLCSHFCTSVVSYLGMGVQGSLDLPPAILQRQAS